MSFLTALNQVGQETGLAYGHGEHNQRRDRAKKAGQVCDVGQRMKNENKRLEEMPLEQI
jgi:hypothetical protein